MEAFYQLLMQADRLIGHKIADFDIPVIEHHYPKWKWNGAIFDTLMVSRMVYISNLAERSIAFRRSAGRSDEAREAALPDKLIKSYSLEAWGYRLRCPKLHADVDPKTFFSQYSEEMLERCISDVRLNVQLYKHLLEKPADYDWPISSIESMLNESKVAYIVGKQVRNGVGFDTAAAAELHSHLVGERTRLEGELRALVPAWVAPDGKPVVPAKSMIRRAGKLCPTYVEQGAEYQKIKTVEFNPASPQHVARVLQKHYGWQPQEFTDSGQPEVSEKIIAGLDYPIIPKLLEYIVADTRLGQLAEGKEAWLKRERDGRIHGQVHVTGTRTSRASHHRPNLAQVPKAGKGGKPYGNECRALFRPTRPDWVQVGADAQGLELRMLGHRLAYFDNGQFAKIVLEGDPHTEFMKATGIFLREGQKEYTYATLYGAGNLKLGQIILKWWRKAYTDGITLEKPFSERHAEELGKVSRDALLSKFGALEMLLERCREATKRGWIRGLDGRVLACKSEHGALNDLLQSDGSILVKHAYEFFYQNARYAQGEPGRFWAPMLFIHDEIECESVPEIAEWIGQEMCDAIREAGIKLGVRCRMDGAYKVGKTWLDCH